ncbi:MAG: Flp pilus assembly complex ATPase component TadA [Methanomicrobiaceae archaeon]|nr:Flp pilus assembly complex ATPase component TadA [Methanomicrobiaceae archaeon]
MNTSRQKELSELIKKIQTQKEDSDNQDSIKKTFYPEIDQDYNKSELQKPKSELEKIIEEIKKQKSGSELYLKDEKDVVTENNTKINEFEPLISSKEIDVLKTSDQNSYVSANDSKKERKETSDINKIFDRIQKAEEIINIKKEEKKSEDKSFKPFEETNGEIITHKSGHDKIDTEYLLKTSEAKSKKSFSELETILEKIKNAEKNTKNEKEPIYTDLENVPKESSKEFLEEKPDSLKNLKEPVNEIIIEESIVNGYETNKKDSNKESFSQQNIPEKEKSIENKNNQGEINLRDKSSENDEENKISKKYIANKTRWSEKDSNQNKEIIQKEEDNAKRETLYSAKKTKWSKNDSEIDEAKAGLISVNEIEKGYSGLVLPEGATFKIEEFSVKSFKKELLPEDLDETISKIDKIYSEHFPPLDLEKITELDLSETKKKEKSKLFDLFKAEKRDRFEYNPSIHGPVVDLSFKEPEGIEEIELYPVNEPYAYIRIVYDKNTNEYIYKIIEPVLNDAENKLLSEIEQRLFETLDINTKDLTKDKATEILKDSVNEIIADYGLKLSPAERAKIIYHINKEFLGNGLIDPIMHDKYIEDISCDGLNTPLFVFHTNYESLQTNIFYKDYKILDSFVTKLAQKAGKYISIAEPMLDATMSDGSRIQMTLGTEVTAHGSTFTIRKFKDEPISPTDLIEWGTFSPLSVAYIWLAVEAGKSCIFAGGTASGKTTSLNAISLFIPPLAKIVTLEDTRELKLPHQNWIPSTTRESFDKDGKGSIDMYELLRAALRQRPEYILVGEVRGAEAQTLFQAMSTGHVTYATMHADSVASVVHRIENPPLNVPRNMLSSLDLISVQVQVRIGGQRTRRNKQLIEILDIDPRTRELITNEVFKWNQATDEIRYSGKSYILEDIMESRGWDEARMVEELKRRQEILEWMRIKKLRNYKDVGKVLMSYYRDPEAVIKLVREDLYE